MAERAESATDPWGRSIKQTLRRWWIIPAALAVLGLVVGGMTGIMTPKSGEALLRVQVSSGQNGGDAQAATSAVAGAQSELSTHQVFAEAARKLGEDEKDLQARTQISNVSNSQILSVKVSASSPEKAAADANAIAEAGVSTSQKRLGDQVKQLTDDTSSLIQQSTLQDKQAENARRAGLGAQLADSQAGLLTQSNQLIMLQQAEAATASKTSPALLALMGLVAGLLVGVAIALLLGGRRGRIRNVETLRRSFPGVEVIRRRDVADVAGLEGGAVDRAVVTAVDAPPHVVRDLADQVSTGLSAAGRQVDVSENVAAYGAHASAVPADGRRGSALVLQAPLTGALARRAAHDDRAVTFVLMQPKKVTFARVDEFADEFGDNTYIVVPD